MLSSISFSVLKVWTVTFINFAIALPVVPKRYYRPRFSDSDAKPRKKQWLQLSADFGVDVTRMQYEAGKSR